MTSKTSPVRLTDRAKLWVAKVLRADYADHGETVVWDVAVAVFPDPAPTVSTQGDDSEDPPALAPLPALVLYLEIPGPDPENSLYTASIVAPFMLTEERIRKSVHQDLAMLRKSRQDRLDSLG
jgi:hypothetical protein